MTLNFMICQPGKTHVTLFITYERNTILHLFSRSFPSNYWDKFVKRKVRIYKLFVFHSILKIMYAIILMIQILTYTVG